MDYHEALIHHEFVHLKVFDKFPQALDRDDQNDGCKYLQCYSASNKDKGRLCHIDQAHLQDNYEQAQNAEDKIHQSYGPIGLFHETFKVVCIEAIHDDRQFESGFQVLNRE